MPLVTTKDMFKEAYAGGYAIGAFNVNNMEIVQGITEAAQELKSPVILQVSAGARKFAKHNYLIKLVEAAIKSVLKELDPHSVYLSDKEMRAQTEQFQGNFSGIGIEFNILNDTLIIVNTVPGGPSEKVGVMPNDKIVAIDGENVVGIERDKAPDKLRGPRGTAVTIGVVRHGVREPLEFRIVRDNIPITTVDASYKIDKSTGYIRVNRFANTTMEEFRTAIGDMGKIDGLVLDLRGNGGGLLNMAIDMSTYFLGKGDAIVSTEGLRTRSQGFDANSNGDFRKGRVIVLIDEFSASASEIVSGALQDWDRAVVVGRRSFGKGLVQQQFPLQDGSAVRITVSKYLTPTGRAIQRPFEMGHGEDYYQQLASRMAARTDSVDNDGRHEAYKTLRLGRTVYGGGGIYPDYYVAVDTTAFSEYLSGLIRRGVTGEFLVDYLDRNRARLEAEYPDFDKFNREYSVDDAMIGELTELGIQRGVEFDAEGLNTSREYLRTYLKGLVAGRLWTTSESYRVSNPQIDPVYKKAVEIMDNWDTMAKGIAADR